MIRDADRTPRGTAGDSAADLDTARQFTLLRELLLGREQHDIAELRRRIAEIGLSADNVAQFLPEAIALRAGQDDRLAHALAPTLETAFSESVQRNPHQIAQAIYPTLGPAIRKAIAEAIGGIVSAINRALEESFSIRGLKWRIEAWRTGVPYAQVVMKHALVFRVEQVYLIHAETGLLLAHVTAPDLSAPDADVISGMLTAIRDFVSDSFTSGGDGALRTFSVGDVTVLVEAGPRAMLAAVVRGQHNPALLRRLQETLELVHVQFAGALARFSGDTAAFEPAQPILAECLETVVDTARERRTSVVPRVAWMLALGGVVALIVVGIRAQGRWSRALDALRQEPGLVVVSAQRGIRGWEIAGLRDPLARSAAAVLAPLGVDTARARGAWAPYLSAEPAIVLRRAVRALAPPASVELAMVGDTLVARGTASTAWIDAASARAGALGGIGAFRDADVAPILPGGLQSLADDLLRTRVLFETGSAHLSVTARETLRRVAEAFTELDAALGTGWVAELDVVGRTDTTGSLELNRTLSDDRARVATDFIMQNGAPLLRLSPRGVGTSDPLPAPTVEERARTNRSVAFALRVRRAPVDESVPSGRAP